MLEKFLDLRHPFFLPAWRRVVATALPLLWSTVEMAQGAVIWAGLFLAAGAYLIYGFFIAWDADAVRKMGRKDD